MPKQKINQKTTEPPVSKIQPSSVESQSLVRHRPFIFGLMGVLVVLIILINAMRTEAALPISDLRLNIVQNKEILEAGVDYPEKVVSWRVVRQDHEGCDAGSFGFLTNQKTTPQFELTADDHDQYYCFKVKDNEGAYAFNTSPLIDTSGLSFGLTIAIHQLDDVLLAIIDNNEEAEFHWRAVVSGGSDCDADVFENAEPDQILEGNLLVLSSKAVDSQYCFEAEEPMAGSYYQLSSPVEEFEAVSAISEGSLTITSVRIYDDLLVARANRPVHWQTVFLSGSTECSSTAFDIEDDPMPRLALAEYALVESSEASRYCFQAYDHLERAFRASDQVSKQAEEFGFVGSLFEKGVVLVCLC